MKECHSCGNMVPDDQTVCPMCGTLLGSEKSVGKTYNRELESMLFACNSNAEIALTKNLGAGIGGSLVFGELQKIETAYLEVIRQFPTEAKPYIAYVDYMIKFIIKSYSVKNVMAYTQYTVNVENILPRCKNYLQKAKEYADDSDLEKILQLDSELTSKIEIIASDPSIKQKYNKAKNINKWCLIGTGIFFAIILLMGLITGLLGV